MGARIFAVADTLDAIMSDRPYRAAQSIKAAREEIEQWSGRQFDPKVVDTFRRMPDALFQDLRREIDTEADQTRRFALAQKNTKVGNA
jgi:HD-GYP domain-containing protein (c-di-GMP phosphodiesterase class II)